MARYEHLPVYKTAMDLVVVYRDGRAGVQPLSQIYLGHRSPSAEPGLGHGHYSRQFGARQAPGAGGAASET